MDDTDGNLSRVSDECGGVIQEIALQRRDRV